MSLPIPFQPLAHYFHGAKIQNEVFLAKKVFDQDIANYFYLHSLITNTRNKNKSTNRGDYFDNLTWIIRS
jgi:hypothetical protein